MANGHQPPTPDSLVTDDMLLRAFVNGDIHAFETLYQRHWHALLTYLVGQLSERALAEEVLQDVMLAVWHGAESFRGEASVRTWIFAIARRQAIRARQRRSRVDLHPLEEHVIESQSLSSEIVAGQDHRAEIHAALNQLTSQQREVIELIFYHGLTGPEVAAVTGVALGTVKSRLRRAKTRLLRLLRLQEIIDA